MDYFENAIKQIHEATAELKADNDLADARNYQEWMAEQRAKLDAIIKMNRMMLLLLDKKSVINKPRLSRNG